MATAYAQADLEAAKERQQAFVQEGMRLKGQISRLEQDLESSRWVNKELEQEAQGLQKSRDSAQVKLDRVRGERSRLCEENTSLKEEIAKLKASLEEARGSRQALSDERDQARQVASALAGRLEESQQRARLLAQRLDSEDRGAIRAEAVREFRASRVLHEEKSDYAAGFIKYGFYAARGFLEEKRPGETFSELVFGEEAEAFVPKDWREYGDPDNTPPEKFLETGSSDLEKPAGPWTPLFQPAESDEHPTVSLDELIPSAADPAPAEATADADLEVELIAALEDLEHDPPAQDEPASTSGPPPTGPI